MHPPSIRNRRRALQPCPVDTFMPMPGSFACMKCPIGFAAPKAGSLKCDFVGFSKA